MEDGVQLPLPLPTEGVQGRLMPSDPEYDAWSAAADAQGLPGDVDPPEYEAWDRHYNA